MSSCTDILRPSDLDQINGAPTVLRSFIIKQSNRLIYGRLRVRCSDIRQIQPALKDHSEQHVATVVKGAEGSGHSFYIVTWPRYKLCTLSGGLLSRKCTVRKKKKKKIGKYFSLYQVISWTVALDTELPTIA